MSQTSPHLSLERAIHLLKERGLVDPAQLAEIELEAIRWAEQQESLSRESLPGLEPNLLSDPEHSKVAHPISDWQFKQERLAEVERFVIEAAEKWQFASDHREGVEREAELSAAIALLINAREHLSR
jgi:hypothetical protein